MKNILIISNNDDIWLKPAWLSVFKNKNKNKDLNFQKIIFVPNKLVNKNFFQTNLYYFSIFGIFDFVKLLLFAIVKKIQKNFSQSKKIEDYIKTETYKFLDIAKLKKEIELIKPDIIFITCSYVIPDELLDTNKNSIWINKHASFLPLTKGLFPFIWNVINNRNQGISFHEVTKKIDSGKIIYQEEILEKQSMVAFYKEIYFSFERYFYNFIYNLEKNIEMDNDGGDYFSLPNKKDLKSFKNKGGKIISFRDIYE